MKNESHSFIVLAIAVSLLNINSNYAGKPSWVEKKNQEHKEEKEKWREGKHEKRDHWKDKRAKQRENWKEERDLEHEKRRDERKDEHHDHKAHHGKDDHANRARKISRIEGKIQKKELEIERLKKELTILKASEE